MNKKIFLLAFLLSASLLFTGCWDKVDLNDRAFVISIGLDKMTDEKISSESDSQKDEKESDDEKGNDISSLHAAQNLKSNAYIFSASIPDLKSYDAGTEKRIIKKTAANTITAAIGVADSFSAQRIYLGHTKAAILGEELLKDSEMLKGCIDVFEKDSELSRKLSVFATDSKAHELLEADTKDDPIFFVSNFLKNNTNSPSIIFKDDVENLIKSLRESGCAVIPKMTVEGDDLRIGGAAVIKDFKLAGYLDDLETRGFLWVKEDCKASIVEAKLDEKDISYKILSSKKSISFSDKLVCKIYIDVKASVAEYDFGKIAEHSNEAETVLENQIVKEVTDTLQKFKKLDTDGFGFKEYLKKYDYDLYLKYSDDNIFQKFSFEVECNAKL